MRILWTGQEKEVLASLYSSAPWPTIHEELAKVSPTGKPRWIRRRQITDKANKLGLKRSDVIVPLGDSVQPELNLGGLSQEVLIEELQRRGFGAVVQTQIRMDQRIKVPTDRFEGDDYIFGLVSDSHFGSQYQQLTHLRSAYALFEQEGIRDVYHAGDGSDGQNLYKGHRYEIFLHGADAQRDYIIEYYPTYDGCTTHMVGGSHDQDHWKRAGSEILKDVAEKRPDIKYYGFFGAFIDVGPISGYLMHGSGGVAYARSYKMQKIVEQFAPEDKPDLLFLGHYHVPCHLPMYRNVECFMLPCFQSQTPYLRSRGLFPAIGAMIIKIRLNNFDRKDGIVMVEPKYVPFYIPKEKDW